MIRSRARPALFVVLCAIVLLPRLGGPHLHLCLDGSAPAVALHVSDGGGEDLLSRSDDSHRDRTVEVSNPVIGKVWPPSLDGPLFLIFALVLAIARQTPLPPVLRTIPVPRSPLFLRPPLRGPPV